MSLQGGESGASGSAGFSVSAHKSVEVPVTVVKEKEVSVIPVEEVKTVHKNVYGEAKYEASNEIAPVAKAGVEATANVNVNAQHGFAKEVSKWKRPYYSTPIIPTVFFQTLFSSLLGSPQRSYTPPMWLPPLNYNYKQVR